MWVAIFTALFAPAPLLALALSISRLVRAAKRRRMGFTGWGALILLAATLTGRHWLRYLRPAKTDEPKPLPPSRRGTLPRPNGVVLEWEEFGPPNAPAVLLAHGWSLTHDTWYYQKQALAKDYRVIVWDMRGTGRSTPPRDRDYSTDALLQDMAAIFDATEVGRSEHGCVLIGHSLGAMLLPLFAEAFPDRMRHVRALAMLAGTDTPLLETMWGREFLTPMRRIFWEPLGHIMAWWPLPWQVLARALWQFGAVHLALMFGMHRGRESRGQDDLAAWHCAHFSMRAAGKGALTCFAFDARAAMPKITVPVLLMTGDADVNMPPDIQRAMAGRLQHPELIVLPNCGHLNLLECHIEVNHYLLDFLQRHLPA